MTFGPTIALLFLVASGTSVASESDVHWSIQPRIEQATYEYWCGDNKYVFALLLVKGKPVEVASIDGVQGTAKSTFIAAVAGFYRITKFALSCGVTELTSLQKADGPLDGSIRLTMTGLPQPQPIDHERIARCRGGGGYWIEEAETQLTVRGNRIEHDMRVGPRCQTEVAAPQRGADDK